MLNTTVKNTNFYQKVLIYDIVMLWMCLCSPLLIIFDSEYYYYVLVGFIIFIWGYIIFTTYLPRIILGLIMTKRREKKELLAINFGNRLGTMINSAVCGGLFVLFALLDFITDLVYDYSYYSEKYFLYVAYACMYVLIFWIEISILCLYFKHSEELYPIVQNPALSSEHTENINNIKLPRINTMGSSGTRKD